MKKMLYCMHVGWNWIKQRPHFIAEELSNDFDMTIISEYSYRTKKVDSSSSLNSNIKIKEFYKIPLFDHFRFTETINNIYRKIFYSYWIRKEKPDYMYVMTPAAVKYLPSDFDGVKLVYDCMDDMLEFSDNEKIKAYTYELEKKLIDKADYVLASSEHLKDVLIKRYELVNPPIVVRNAYNGNIKELNKSVDNNKLNFEMCYFGTIAEWFNFDYIINVLNEIDNLEILLIGPLQSGTVIPQHERIKYIGSVEHKYLEEKTKDVDAFIMPFVVNDLIESVDPVKIYEYINFGKNILCVRYNEVLRFNDFVYFYDDYESFKSQILTMMSNRELKYSSKDRIDFLKENTWEYRANLIRESLDC